MDLVGKDLISIFALSDSEIEAIFDLADEMSQFTRSSTDLCRGKLMATLFYEPSTRTRLSFEAAMQRLGGGVLSCADPRSTSAAKGETIADTVRIVESYADIIVIRHPLAGSARVAADYARVPVINGGDGAHEHPTQTLLDLYTIRREKGRLKGVSVALCGDLRHARTAHSLAYGLARFGAQIICVAPQALEMPDHVLNRLASWYDCVPRKFESLEDVVTDPKVIEELGGKQVSSKEPSEVISLFDAIYVTRVQRERFESPREYEAAKKSYAITESIMQKAKPDTLVMHPLPRVDEMDYAIDSDPRAAYFRQAAYGVPVRMALVALILGVVEIKEPKQEKAEAQVPQPQPADLSSYPDLRCDNPKCVISQEFYLQPEFWAVEGKPEVVRCGYCDHEISLTKRKEDR